uniref:Ion_trans_2 domain-containing protein n=1 Tax=Syphacia muris TaxID=451379 RepID=A0A0N5ANT8_9BILA
MKQYIKLVRVLVPQLLVVILFILYVVAGSAIFVMLDEKIANETFTEVLLFSFTTLTTIGYGNISPATKSSQLFCIAFSIVGIPMALLTLANLGKYLTKVYWLMLVCFGKVSCQNANMPLPTTITLLLVTFAFGSFFFYETGRGFTVDDIYFSVISFSTVGFGDRKPSADNPWMLMGMVLYLIWGMILMTTLFAAISVYLRAVFSFLSINF